MAAWSQFIIVIFALLCFGSSTFSHLQRVIYHTFPSSLVSIPNIRCSNLFISFIQYFKRVTYLALWPVYQHIHWNKQTVIWTFIQTCMAIEVVSDKLKVWLRFSSGSTFVVYIVWWDGYIKMCAYLNPICVWENWLFHKGFYLFIREISRINSTCSLLNYNKYKNVYTLFMGWSNVSM